MQSKQASNLQHSSEKDKQVRLVGNDRFQVSLMRTLNSERPMTIGEVVAIFSSEKWGEIFQALARLHRTGQVLFQLLESELELMVEGSRAWNLAKENILFLPG